MAWHASELEHFPALTWDEIAPRASVAIRARAGTRAGKTRRSLSK